MQEISELVIKAVADLFTIEVEVELTRPDEQFGDYATNVAMRLSKKVGQTPREIAEKIAGELLKSDDISKAEVAGPGFINIILSEEALLKEVERAPEKSLQDQVIVAEYSDPNPFKILHAGHLYTSVIGDSIANLLEAAGGQVHRVNYGGDVGLHVGKTLWAVLQDLGGEHPDKLADIPKEKHSEWLTECYTVGTAAYDENEDSKSEIIELNKKVYEIQREADCDSKLAKIYWTTRQWSYEYFDEFYEKIGVDFEKYYPESETVQLGLETVKKHIGSVYKESDGAIVFEGEPYGLHTRVFINKEGLPTYETKDIGVIQLKKNDFNFDKSIVMTGNEQAEYMKVVLKSLEQYEPELVQATTHITHGLVKMAGGVKMSSRKGNILRAADILEEAREANKSANNQDDEHISLGAIKYSFLKNRIGGDLIYNPEESVSLQGNSGPYLQYAHARARSIIAKSQALKDTTQITGLQKDERNLLRKISEYAEVVERATNDLMPHHICTYLYELAQAFNRFYENNRVIDDEREALRLQLVELYAQKLKSGLELLGIHAPEKM